MLINKSPVEETLSEIEHDILAGSAAINPWNAPQGLPLALEAGARALTGLQAVHAAIADLEPGAAIIITEALERGLAATR